MQFRTRHQGQAVGTVGERHHAFEIVIAIRAAPDHPKGQVDLGAPVLDEQRRRRGRQDIRFSIFHARHRECLVQTAR
jgi:hypothetical protein